MDVGYITHIIKVTSLSGSQSPNGKRLVQLGELSEVEQWQRDVSAMIT